MAIHTNSTGATGRGGARPGAGRPKGSRTKLTSEAAMKAAAEGISPLDFMLRMMRTEPPDDLEPADMLKANLLRFEAAKAAAPYCHPRLTSVEHSVTGMSKEDALRQLASSLPD